MIDGKKLRAYREGAELTQTELAKRVGIAQTYYSRIERGLSSASQETLQAIIQVLNISIGDIWDDGKSYTPPDASATRTQGIVIEHGVGKNKKRYILPPTSDSYAFLERQMESESSDQGREAFIQLWDSADKNTKDKVLAILADGEAGASGSSC